MYRLGVFGTLPVQLYSHLYGSVINSPFIPKDSIRPTCISPYPSLHPQTVTDQWWRSKYSYVSEQLEPSEQMLPAPGKRTLVGKENIFFFSLPSGWQSGFLTNSFTSLRKFTCVSKPCKRECQGECSRQSACHGSMRTRVCILSNQTKTGRGDTYLYPQL